ncbi:MAG: hypothetical protein A2020_07490 [Lentisphaerae bacterium GWF2_45_14]|nr:MAG: hypothetical protein A2020_07490 [Lentisphaerae bacterium GWF2_45_14]
MEINALLEKCELFEGLKVNEVKMFLKKCEQRFLGAGEILFKEGDKSDDAYIVVDGRLGIRCRILAKDQSSVPLTPVISYVEPGCIIGEFALIDSKPRSAEVFAPVATEILVINHDAFHKAISLRPETGYRLMFNVAKILADKMRDTNEKLMEIMKFSWKAYGFNKL